MFEQLFQRPYTVVRHRDGPLAEERLRYLRHLAEQGMCRRYLKVVASRLLIIIDYLRLANRPTADIDLTEIEQQASLWAKRLAKGEQRKYSWIAFCQHAKAWLRFLGRLRTPVPIPEPCAHLIDAFAAFMHSEQGLSAVTIDVRRKIIQGFLHRLRTTPQEFREITITQIDDALMEKIRSSGFARATILSYTSILRTFFRFAGRQGWCCPGLAAAIHSPRIYRQETLPSCPSWDDVQRLLATTEGDRPTDIRDRAILMLLAIYGLRAGEVVRLRLEDFDWEQERLHVLRPKANRAQIYPLSRSVGNAVLRYLKEVRPRSSLREVFLTRRVPYRLLSAKAVWPIVSCRFDALGVSLPHQGPHSLRHACATHLLEQGLSLTEIADHLGHLHPVTTQIYTKVDLARLRKVGEFDMGGLL